MRNPILIADAESTLTGSATLLHSSCARAGSRAAALVSDLAWRLRLRLRLLARARLGGTLVRDTATGRRRIAPAITNYRVHCRTNGIAWRPRQRELR